MMIWAAGHHQRADLRVQMITLTASFTCSDEKLRDSSEQTIISSAEHGSVSMLTVLGASPPPSCTASIG